MIVSLTTAIPVAPDQRAASFHDQHHVTRVSGAEPHKRPLTAFRTIARSCIFDRPTAPCYDAPIDTETVQHSTTRESRPMQKPLHLQTTVLPGGKIVIVDQDLAEGETVEIFVTASSSTPRRSAIDILAESPGHRLFKTPQDVTDYIESERASWDR